MRGVDAAALFAMPALLEGIYRWEFAFHRAAPETGRASGGE